MRSIGIQSDGPQAAAIQILDRPLYVVPLAMLVTGVPILAHLVSPVLGFACCFLAAVAMANFAPRAVPVTLVFSMAFQNMIVASVTPYLPDDATAFNLIRSYSFVMVVSFWATFTLAFLLDARRSRSGLDRMILLSYGVLPFVALYFLLGAAKEFMPATAYLRSIATPIFCLQIGMIAGRHIHGRPEQGLMALGWLAVAYGYLEVIFDIGFLRLFNGDTYLSMRMRDSSTLAYWVVMMKQTGFVLRDQLDMLRVSLFNTPLLADLDITLFRLHGPNFHPISYAYGLSFFALVGMANRRLGVMVAALPLLIFIGSKGVVIMLVLGGGGYLMARLWRSHLMLAGFVGVLCIYIGAAIVVGMRIGDFHVLGLFGCLEGFRANPLGHGLGQGGNLSGGVSIEDWQQAQAAGKISAALESGVGVLLYQMGIGAVAVLALYGAIVVWCWRRFRETSSVTFGLATFAIATLLANAILQEEAVFSPLALGTLLLWVGHALGRSLTWESSSVTTAEVSSAAGTRVAMGAR